MGIDKSRRLFVIVPMQLDQSQTNGVASLASTANGVDGILRAVRTHLRMDVAFVAQFRATDRLFTHVDASGASPIACGDALNLESGYCKRVVEGRLPELIPDAGALPETAALPETRAIPIGSHISVPIRLRDGSLYGTFCCFSFAPDPLLNERDLQMMHAIADVIADQIDRDLQASREQQRRRGHLEQALLRGDPHIVYQPIFNLQTGHVVALESLSRFATEPPRPPDAWFAEASELGLGPRLESLAANRALGSLDKLPPGVGIAVNVSPATLLSGSFADLLSAHDLTRLTLEITEHASISDYDQLLMGLAPYRALGLKISVDDAGAGYASMRHILNLEPDSVKLDISLTRRIDQDRKRRALAAALIAFAEEASLTIIAEGVETAAELAVLRQLGVDQAQGYYLSRPGVLEHLSFDPLPQIADRLPEARAAGDSAAAVRASLSRPCRRSHR